MQIAQSSGADKYAADSFQKAQTTLQQNADFAEQGPAGFFFEGRAFRHVTDQVIAALVIQDLIESGANVVGVVRKQAAGFAGEKIRPLACWRNPDCV